MTHTFDIAWDCPIQDFLSLLDRFDLKLESWITFGPGGGNPEITVSVSEESIEQIRENIFG
jgi:hypothetical protein